jgi:hypothetical protein
MGMDTIFSLPGINTHENPLRLHVLQDYSVLVVKLSNDLSNETANINKH